MPSREAVFVAGDLAQIETRVIAWLAGEEALLDAFREGRDVYSEFGTTHLFRRRIDRSTPKERAIAKATVLGCVFGMGAKTFLRTCLQNGIDVDEPLAERAVRAMRSYAPRIVQLWYDLLDGTAAIVGSVPPYRKGKLRFIRDAIVKPNGTRLYYNKMAQYPDGTMTFVLPRNGVRAVVNVWHGLLAENVTQSVARDVLADVVVRLLDGVETGKLPFWMEPVLTTHDDLVLRVPRSEAEEARALLHTYMTTPPAWAPDLPVEVETKVGATYGDL